MTKEFGTLDLQVARARVVVSILAVLSIYIDPNAGGLFHLGPLLLTTLGCHLLYSAIANVAVTRHSDSSAVRALSTILDLSFATGIAFLTEGGTSPSFVFFVFAIVAAVSRMGARDTLLVTLYSVSLYALVIAFSHGLLSHYMMRAVYLAIDGYLIGFFGRERVRFETRLRELEAETERMTIARSLHDGYIQALAGINLRLETCRDMLRCNQVNEALAEAAELQTGIEREYDRVRSYVRFLAKTALPKSTETMAAPATAFRFTADFVTCGSIIEHLLQIVLEGVRNVQRHARAGSSTIAVEQGAKMIRVRLDDDGVGFGGAKVPPWTIASRVAELNGRLRLREDLPVGAHLEMEIPTA